MSSRRLLMAGRGGGGFSPPAFTVSGPYAPDVDHARTILTQLHCHTTQSDGLNTPAEVVAGYLAAGYEALMLTDHDLVSSQPAGITTAITGNEHSPTQQHIIAINSDYTRGGTTDAQTIIDAIVADGGQAELAHPNWSIGLTYAEMAALTDYLGIEIHNGHVVSGSGQDPVTYPAYALDRWDELLVGSRRDIWAFSVDDRHSDNAYSTYDMGRVQVFAASNNVTNIMASLQSGNFVADVANFGVTPGFPYRTPAGVAVQCPGAVRIEAWGAAGLLTASTGDTHAHTLDGTEDYVRLVAVGDYEEMFGAALSNRWYDVSGVTSVSGGSLNFSTDATARKVILRRHREGDFQMEADVEVSAGGTDAIALMWNVLDDNHFYMARIGESTVTGYNNELAVAKTTNGGFANGSQLDNATFNPTSGTTYTIKVDYTAVPGRIQAKVWETGTTEPAFQVDVTDTAWRFGAFGIRANRSCKVHRLYISGFQTFYQPIAIDPA